MKLSTARTSGRIRHAMLEAERAERSDDFVVDWEETEGDEADLDARELAQSLAASRED